MKPLLNWTASNGAADISENLWTLEQMLEGHLLSVGFFANKDGKSQILGYTENFLPQMATVTRRNDSLPDDASIARREG